MNPKQYMKVFKKTRLPYGKQMEPDILRTVSDIRIDTFDTGIRG